MNEVEESNKKEDENKTVFEFLRKAKSAKVSNIKSTPPPTPEPRRKSNKK